MRDEFHDPGVEPYRDLENIYAVITKMSDGGDSVVFLRQTPLITDAGIEALRPAMRLLADAFPREEFRAYRFVRAELLETMGPKE